jgi:hypothetical protein
MGALFVTFAASAYAEPTATEKDTARGLMADGRTKRDAKDLQGALKSFEAADAIMHVPSTGWEVANTQLMMGLLVEARDTALRVMRIPETPREPAAFQEARTKAQTLVDDLDARIPVVTVTVKGAPDGAALTVTVDDKISLPGAALAAPIRLNPGKHVIAVKSDKLAGSQQIEVAEKDKKELTVTLEASAATPPPVDTSDKPPEDKPPPPPEQKHTMRTVAWIGFGVGGAGLIAGAITGFLTLSAKSSALNNCQGNRCPPSAFSDLDTANTMSTISTVSFIVAGVGAGVGLTALIIGDKPKTTEPSTEKPAEPAPQQGVRVIPWIGVGSAGVRGTF